MTRFPIKWLFAVMTLALCASTAWGQLTITPATLPTWDAGTPYSQSLSASGGVAPYAWTVTTSGGLTLNADGSVTGTPVAAGTIVLQANVTDSSQPTPLTGSQSISIPINAALSVATTTLPGGTQGVAYSTPLTATGGTGSYTWTLLNVNPAAPWLSLVGGALTATTPLAGSYTVTVQVTDSIATVQSAPLTLAIAAPPLSVTTTTLPSGEASAPYSGTTLAATGGSPPYTWSVSAGSLPANLVLNPTTGAISGTLATAATTVSGLVFKATDASSASASSSPLTLTVTPGPSISTPSLAQGDAGFAYSQTLAASGGTQPYTWSIPAASLPPGITLNSTTGVLSGTTSAAATYPLNVTVTDSVNGTGTASLSLIINPALTISTQPSLTGTVGTVFSQTLAAAGGSSPYTWSIKDGSLPAGVTLNGATLIGTPTSSGVFAFTVQVTDSISVSATKAFTINIAPGLTIVSGSGPTLPPGVVGGPYSDTLSATGGTAPYTFSVTGGALPAGLTLSSSGTISGTPTQGGTFTFTIQAADSNSVKAAQSFSLSIAALLAITTQPTLPSGGVGTAYSQTLTAVGGTAPYTWSVISGALPGGLSLNGGVISGTPTTVGNFSFTVQVRDNNSVTTTEAFTLSIVSALTITSAPTLPVGAVGVGYSQAIVVVGGTAPYTWSISSGGLPAGLSLAPATGAISGSPTNAGSFTFTVQVIDSASLKQTKAFTIEVVAGLTITTAPVLPSDSVGVSYTVTLAAAGGQAPYTWTVSAGGLPGGLVLDAKSGAVFGTPTASGTFNFTAKVTDNASNTATKQLTIAIAAGLTITTAPVLSNGAIGAAYSAGLNAVGGAAPYVWSVPQGTLPAGLTLDPGTGLLSGVPSAAGQFTFQVKVTDSASASSTKTFDLAISTSLVITTPATLPIGSVGLPYTISLVASGGSGSYQWKITSGNLPAGMALSSNTGALSGTPVSSGSFVFTVEVTDSSDHAASQQFSLVIASGIAISTPATLPSGSVGTPYSQMLTAIGGTPPYRWTVASGAVPPGLGVNAATGLLAGTPLANGTFHFTVRVTDNTGATASLAFTLSIGSGLAITSSTLPPGTLGAAYAFQFAEAGGVQPYTWAITSGAIAPGLVLSGSGAVSGTPTTAGAFTFTVQVTDANGATASQVFTISVAPPGVPQISVTGVPESSTAAQQITFDVALSSTYALDITGTVSIAFTPDAVAPAVDPAIQFSTGGTSVNFTIPKNTTSAVFGSAKAPQIGLQTGTVSGAVTLNFTFAAGNVQLTALTRTITIPRAAPAITAVKVVTSGNSFQVEVTGFSTPRELTEADLTFTPASGASLQTTKAVIDLTAVGKQWFQSSQSAQFGSQYILVLPFTASQGSISAVASVTVTLKNSEGSSSAVSANF